MNHTCGKNASERVRLACSFWCLPNDMPYAEHCANVSRMHLCPTAMRSVETFRSNNDDVILSKYRMIRTLEVSFVHFRHLQVIPSK